MKQALRDHLLAILGFFITFAFTLYLYQDARTSAAQRNADFFNYRTDLAKSAVERRMNHYVQILKGARAYFSAVDTVSRSEWRQYVSSLELDVNYPGIQGIGYAVYLKPEDVQAHIQNIRSSGFPDYTISPPGERPEYTSTIYLEPFTGRNLRAFGFDMMSEPIRRAALETARSTGQPTLTGKVTLVQETNKDIQPGFLIYLPIYNSNTELNTPEERKPLLKGFVFTPFRSKDLITAILGKNFTDLGIEIYDGENPTPESILFDSDTINEFSVFGQKTVLTRKINMRMYGQTWQIHFIAMPEFGSLFDRYISAFILTVGTIISLLLYFALWSLVKLRKANSLKQTITDNATAALFLTDPVGYCTFMNPAAVEMTGYTLEEIRRKPLHEVVHTPQNPPDEKNNNGNIEIRQLQNRNNTATYEDLFYHKNGRSFPVQCSAKPVYHNGQAIATVLEVIDITEQKAAEQKIKSNAEFLQKVFLEVPAVVGILRVPDQVYILANDRLRALYNNRVLVGKTFTQAHPELVEQGYGDFINSVFETGEPFVGKEMEAQVSREGQEGLSSGFFDLVYQPIKNERNELEAVMIFAVEVTELVFNRRKLVSINNELSSKNRELVRTNTDLDNFIYTASHDLKSPITNLEGLTLYLKENLTDKLNGEDLKVLEMFTITVNKLKRTIQDLGEITKVQKEIEESTEPLYINEVLDDVLFDLRSHIDATHGTIKTDLELNNIVFARKNLRSIFYNLISNGIKYRSPDRPPELVISTRSENDCLILKVQDNGLGLKPEQREKLFVMFKRLHSHVEGTGIGLYIIKRIIENHGGRIEVASELGTGTTFTITLPLQQTTHNQIAGA